MSLIDLNNRNVSFEAERKPIGTHDMPVLPDSYKIIPYIEANIQGRNFGRCDDYFCPSYS